MQAVPQPLNRTQKRACDRSRFPIRPIAYCVALACCELAAAAQPTGATIVSGTAPMGMVTPNHLKISNSPGLLVSVRSAAEAITALEAGADVIDVKEPSRGALGAASF